MFYLLYTRRNLLDNQLANGEGCDVPQPHTLIFHLSQMSWLLTRTLYNLASHARPPQSFALQAPN
jgi:hypothetical protein